MLIEMSPWQLSVHFNLHIIQPYPDKGSSVVPDFILPSGKTNLIDFHTFSSQLLIPSLVQQFIASLAMPMLQDNAWSLLCSKLEEWNNLSWKDVFFFLRIFFSLEHFGDPIG